METEDVLVVKPKFNYKYEIMRRLWDIVIGIGIIYFLTQYTVDPLRYFIIVVAISAVIFVLYLIFLKWYASKRYKYVFEKDKVTYTSSIFSKTPKSVMYEEFKELKYTQGIMQQRFNIGDIMLTRYGVNPLKKYIIVYSIENIREVYEEIGKRMQAVAKEEE
jgi:membrane protein YdbS with pleckstrin-like domain